MRERRRHYERERLGEEELPADPFALMQLWLDEALASDALLEPHAMTLATVDAAGRPSARIVLLREFDARGLVFFTNYESRKGREIASTGLAAALLYWDYLERQVRVEGEVERLTEQESDAYFAGRPRSHRLSAWASPQSRPIPDRAGLEQAMREAEQRWVGEAVPRPPYWGGYRIVPQFFEFWQGRLDRLHDRISYRLVDTGWQMTRLAP
jgi:pyridoxamine 5'-phosphate oxidase